MDPWQDKRQLAESLLPPIVWADAPQAAVLTGGSFVSEDEPGDFIPREVFLADGPASKGMPFAVVHTRSSKTDINASLNRYSEVRLGLWVVVGAKGITDPNPTADTAVEDTHGLNRVTGKLRDPVQGQGKSTGRDIDEVTNRLLEALNRGVFIESIHGFQGYVESQAPAIAISGVQVLARLLEIVILNSSPSRWYHPARGMKAVKIGANAVLTWLAPLKRFDSTLGVVRRGAASGDPAPTSPTSGGTLVSAAVPVGAVGISDAPGAGTWNYAYWPGYGETPAAQQAQVPDRYPSSVTAGVVI